MGERLAHAPPTRRVARFILVPKQPRGARVPRRGCAGRAASGDVDGGVEGDPPTPCRLPSAFVVPKIDGHENTRGVPRFLSLYIHIYLIISPFKENFLLFRFAFLLPFLHTLQVLEQSQFIYIHIGQTIFLEKWVRFSKPPQFFEISSIHFQFFIRKNFFFFLFFLIIYFCGL